MITGIDQKSIIKTLNRESLPDYWGQYFVYEKDIELYELTETALLEVIESAKGMSKPFIDSKIAIGKILTEFGPKSNFHRQFSERHQELHKEQVLGMQLYKLMIEDRDVWIFHETQHVGHVFPNATYFQQGK